MKGLLFISHRTEKYDYLDSIEIALKGGCRLIQLRMKNAAIGSVEVTAREAKTLCDQYKARLFIDDYVEVCKQVKAYGVHLGKSDMPLTEARRILGNGFIIGSTANTIEDILQSVNKGANYIGLGPFRFTSTKEKLSPVLGLQGYRKIMEQCRANNLNLPVFAIGGINVADISVIMETGISGIAVSSAILNADNPIEETKKIIDTINRNHI